MPTPGQYRHEDVATVPRGWKVRTTASGAHKIRVAFPPGPRRKGVGRLISILHPLSGNPRKCNSKIDHEIKAIEAKRISEGITPRERKRWVKLVIKKRGWNAREKNQSAAQVYTNFHGRGPHEVLEVQERLLKAGDYAALGDMGSLWLTPVKGEPSHWPQPDIEFEKSDKVKLATDAKTKQLYLIGGNQQLPLAYLEKHGVSTSRRFISLGEVYGISYVTAKNFDGFRESEYAHEFGENTGERPFAYYDAELHRIVLVGGAYSIAGLDDALGASPGIVN